ncbi:hypothetical protein [Fimbriiglobus ruber]|uniref:Uncharacterized protein n=1 Tax=Fimbriiglobus ruber TaxID=1908690 RepID=A0A225E975_9BACT|nr:hypothetical protein [Fimbriiglobus ruber]OWK45145.1 hypothetical protein FRUB_01476 [Fimbriiglobus ruber]
MAKESRDQRRKKKLAEEKRKERQNQSLAYMGEKFKTDKLIPTWMHAEIGIYETYVISDRKLLDQTVVDALEKLIRMMKAGPLPPLPEADAIHYETDGEEDLVIENVRRSWARHFATEWKPPRDDLIGVLRTILGSIQKVKAPSPLSQSYMHHIAGFLTKKLGVTVKMVTSDREPLPEPKEGDLVRLGRRWSVAGNADARTDFLELAAHLMKTGQANRVIDDGHLLMGELSDPSSPVVHELMALIHKARESLLTTMG